MAGNLGDLIVRVGADIGGFKDAFKDAVELLETTGEKATRVGSAISKAFANLGISDAAAKTATEAKKLQASFELLEKAFKDGKISAADYAKAQEGLKTQLERLSGIAPKLAQDFSKLGDAFRSLGVAGTKFQITEQIEKLRTDLKLLEDAQKAGKISAEDFALAQKHVATEIDKLTKIPVQGFFDKFKDLEKIGTSLKNVGTTLSVALTAPLVAFGAAAIKSAADMESLEIGLKAVTKEAGPLEVQLNRLKEVAKLPGLAFKEAVQGSINLQAAGLSAQMAERGLRAFGNALATVGKGRVELEGVNLALTQLATKPKVLGQEINQLAERLPQIRAAMMQAFGTADTEVLQKMGISTRDFIEKIIVEFEKLPKATGGFKNEMENLRDSFDQMLATVGRSLIPFAAQALKALEPVIAFVKDAAQRFAELPPSVKEAAVALGLVAAAIGPLTFAAGGLLSSLSTISTAFAALGAGGAAANAATGLGTMATASTGAATALTALGTAAGVAGAAIGSYLIFTTAIDSIKELAREFGGLEGALKTLPSPLREVVGAFETFGAALKVIFGHRASTKGGDENAWGWLTLGLPNLKQAVLNALGPLGQLAARLDQLAEFKRKFINTPDLPKPQAPAAPEIRTSAQSLAEEYEKERNANLRALEAAQAYLKMVKETKGSKEQLADATRKVTEAQRKLNPEFKAGGDAAGSYGKKLDETKFKAISFNKALLDQLTNARQVQRELALASGKEQEWHFKLITGEFDADVERLKAGVDAVNTSMGSLRNHTQEAQVVLDVLFKEATKDASKLDEAMKATGQVSLGELLDKAKKTQEAFQQLQKDAAAGIISQTVLLQGQKAMLEDQMRLAQAQGKPWQDYERQIEAVNQKLLEHGIKVKGMKDSWADFSKEVSTIITNFTQDMARTLFDGTKDWGAKFTSLWKDLASAVTAVFIQPITAALTKFVSTTLTDLIGGKGFGGLTKSINDVGAALSRVFGGGASAAGGVASAAGGVAGAAGGAAGQAGGAAGALGSVSNLTGIVGAVGGVVSAISGVVSNFQFAAMNKSLDIIVKHTLQTANDLANLRSDSWMREDHLMAKLDDLWRTLLDTKDFLGTIMLGAVETISVKLDDLAAVMSRGTSATEQVADGVVAPIPILEQIKDAITDGASQIVAAIRAGGIGGGGTGAAAGSSGRLAELQMKLTDMFERQANILAELPPEIQEALKSGSLPPATEGEFRELITQFYSLHDTIVALQDEIARLTPQGGTGSTAPVTTTPRQTLSNAINPETMTLDPSQLRTTVIATGTVGGSMDASGIIEALGSLYGMLETKFDQLLKVFGVDGLKGIEKKMQGTTMAVDGSTEATKQTTLAVDDTTSAVMESTRVLARASGDLGSVLGSAIQALPEAVGASVATATSLVEGSIRESIGGQPFDYAALRMPAIPEFNPDYARPRTAFEVNNAYNRPVVQYNISGNSFRNRDDLDYFVDRLNDSGIR